MHARQTRLFELGAAMVAGDGFVQVPPDSFDRIRFGRILGHITNLLWPQRNLVDTIHHHNDGVMVISKLLIILMLATTQLLSGSGVSLYLCISNDGIFCIHWGAVCGNSCQSSSESSCGSCSNDDAEQRRNQLCRSRDSGPLDHLAIQDSCDCTHIPIALSSGQPTAHAQTSVTVDSERLSSNFVQMPCIGFACLPMPLSAVDRFGASKIPDFTLTVVSTVIIRC